MTERAPVPSPDELQPLPTLAEKLEMGTVNERLNGVRASIANLERQLEEARAAADITADEEKHDELLNDIQDVEEALAHLREEERELVAHNTDTETSAASDEEMAA